MQNWRSPHLKKLAETLIAVNSKENTMNFLRDLCTLEELRAMATRWQAVTLLAKKVPYREIARQTGLSTATVSRVAHWLHHGEGGYQAALQRLKKG